MSSTVDKIKEKLNVSEVIGSYIDLEKSGTNFKAKCPFHNERTPSFFVSPDRGSFYCFGCGAKGDIFNFVQEFEGLDFVGALKVLADRAGVEIKKENPKSKSEKEKLHEIMEVATLFFQNNLIGNKQAQDYVLGRGLNKDTLKKFRVGFSENDWRNLYDFLKRKGFSEEQMEKAGLIKKTIKGGLKYYDTFRGRIMFPIFDTAGRVIAFSGRIVIADEKSPKYLNSPDTELFNKSEVLYGLNFAKDSIRKDDYSILVEGQMDLLMAHQVGFLNTVASSGTALTEKHLQKLKRFSNKMVVVYDSDTAGFAASIRGAAIALSLGMDVKLVALPQGADPAEMILKNQAEWTRSVKEAKHIIDFYTDNLLSSNNSSLDIIKEVKNKIFPFLVSLPSNIEKNYFVSRISNKLNLREEVIWSDLEDSLASPNGNLNEEFEKKDKILVSRKDLIERKIAGFVFWQSNLKNTEIESNYLKNRIDEVAQSRYFEQLLSKFEPIKDEVMFEAESYYHNKESIRKDIDELILNFEEDYLKTKFVSLMLDLSKFENKQNSEETTKILNECQKISMRIADLMKQKNI